MLGRKVVTGGEQHRLMERPSEAAHSGGNTWKRLLITVSILHCQIQPTPAQGAPVNVVPNPPYGTVGSSITLNIQGFSGQALSYTWYRRSVETYHQIAVYSVPYGVQNPSHIRQKVLPNGSLLISNLIFNDSDDYFIQIVDNTIGVIETGKRYLSVYGLPASARRWVQGKQRALKVHQEIWIPISVPAFTVGLQVSHLSSRTLCALICKNGGMTPSIPCFSGCPEENPSRVMEMGNTHTPWMFH
ncbi:pregnancy-specific glycoprotein 22-like isoform X2 [Macrotis lagotis]|uniref:pregnancy-specific glycoprotein 22-like isoform X2 n=1 Tax=Macrotis lagotis TaxID=92651 RepID=UPI003D68FF64